MKRAKYESIEKSSTRRAKSDKRVVSKEPKKRVYEFRLSAKHLFLTYSQTLLTKEEVLDQLTIKLLIKRFVICQEDHKSLVGDEIGEEFDVMEETLNEFKDFEDPSEYLYEDEDISEYISDEIPGKHIHVYLELETKANIRSPRTLDLIDSQGNQVHGEYQAAKRPKSVISYCKKDGDFLTNINELDDYSEENLIRIADEKGITAAMNYFSEKNPGKISTRYGAVKSNLTKYLESKPEPSQGKYSIDSFKIPSELQKWYDLEKEKLTLVVIGPSGIGKTQLMMSFLESEGLNPLLITDINGLNGLKPENKSIIFDDINFEDIKRETKIHLVDKEVSGDIRILYKTVRIPKDVLKVITANSMDGLRDTYGAIARRIRELQLPNRPLYVNVTINNNINTINNISNNILQSTEGSVESSMEVEIRTEDPELIQVKKLEDSDERMGQYFNEIDKTRHRR